MKAELWKEELTFMNEQAGFDGFGLHGVENFIEGHDHGFEVRLEKFKSEIGAGLQTGDGDALTGQLFFAQGLGGNDDGAVIFAEAGAAIEEDVLVAERRV